MNTHHPLRLALLAALPFSVPFTAGHAAEPVATTAAAQPLERVLVTGSRPASMPLEIPTTLESLSGAQIERSINATDSEDALKYFPSLNVRKRYLGDYDHAVLATRASGTGNSARSLVYADGVLLSNLLGNGASFTPRWGLVTPEEIDRVDVLYGPFSAAYSGNSAGAIVDYITRMPSRFEAHVKLQASTQKYDLYNTHDRYSATQFSASLGSRSGGLSWWVNVNRLDAAAQPIGFVIKNVPAASSAAGTPVTGAVFDRNPRNVDGYVLGTTAQTNTVQDHAKLKLAYDFSPALRASYTLGIWRNQADRKAESFLRDAAGQAVSSGTANRTVNVDGRSYSITPTDFAASRADLEHFTHGLSLKSNARGRLDWEMAASVYDYSRDRVRSQFPVSTPQANANAGRITDQQGTGWNTLALKAIWRPEGVQGTHTLEGGLQRDAFRLRTVVSNTPDWLSGAATGTAVSRFQGDSRLTSLWLQDAWRFAPQWKAVIGGRAERWQAFNGAINGVAVPGGARSEAYFSPKAALSFQPGGDWVYKASVGRAVRVPTVSELFQGTTAANAIVNNDPNLKPEKSWTAELSAERDLGAASLRATLFAERTRDALYSQTNVSVTPSITNIQNVDAIRTHGLELALQGNDAFVKGLELMSSLTFADSKITRNDKFPASVGKWQPRVPQWRASALASYTIDARWSGSLGARYSGRQFGQLDNSDSNGFAYTGFSKFFVADVRAQYRFTPQWKASIGIDNLNNQKYWAFHPYPQRTFVGELRFDL